VLLLRGQNPSRVLEGVHRKVGELNRKILPADVKIVPYLDRITLVKTTVDMARFSSEQAERNWQAARLKAEVEIRQAYARYQAAVARIAKYKEGVLRDAASVFEAKLYSYRRGHTSLLEVLNAQREENNVYLSYYDALTEYAKALVTLEQAAGIWDVKF